MKIAIVYNRQSKSVINLFGRPNKEIIGLKTIKRLTDSLRQGGHQVVAFEGDKDLVERLGEFMPRVVKGERPGMVFNVSYGIQGEARYTHVPSILEMVGVPYVASGPLAHSLCLDKVVTKMILRQHGLPTPDFAVLNSPNDPVEDLKYPLIVKPKNEAVSFGLKVVNNAEELREGAGVIFDKFHQPVLVEQFIEGREVNVGLLGNNPPEAFPPTELMFGTEGPQIYTYEDKTNKSGRTIRYECPAPLDKAKSEEAKELGIKAFQALGCYDCARVDMRMDKDGNLYILEINSLPSLGEHGSYLIGAQAVGLDFTKFVNRLVEESSARYFGTPEPPDLVGTKRPSSDKVTGYITQRRDEMERQLSRWAGISSRSSDPIGIQEAVSQLEKTMTTLKLKRNDSIGDERSVWLWETAAGYEGGVLLVGHLDTPADRHTPRQRFRRDPEWLYGDGIGTSRAPLVMLDFALRSLRSSRVLNRIPLGVMYYTDEGSDARYSREAIREAAGNAKHVLVLRPGNAGEFTVTKRRGQRVYRFLVEGKSRRPGKIAKSPDPFRWTTLQLEEFAQLTKHKARVSVSTTNIESEKLPMLLPHRIVATILMTYPDAKVADAVEARMRSGIKKSEMSWQLELVSDRPPMAERKRNLSLARQLEKVATDLEIPLHYQSSVWPSVAGLVPSSSAALCGVGPVARDIGTPNEAVERISLVQRTLILAQFLGKDILK
ncbi:MAG: ATP-grasp domain-containing protein [Candidatus Eisenbacteria bacterium]|uniref:ATP-grasp domain-containing protein n=1 Tax=Eiseniibacteriota bacterium TaxID=2212470 RepID=A0A7Y2EBQ0_UNCEI|nr:ATP-grasp domain-containing protein [Candidatus Eisenbacteria bacterium]